MRDAAERRAFTGVFELVGPSITPGSSHVVAVRTADGERATLSVRTLPDRLPDRSQGSLDDRFNVLLVSCFHRLTDQLGLAGRAVANLPASFRPDLTILMGDQVYLDLPTLRNFRDDAAWLARKFEREDYVENWAASPGYSQILGAAPTVAVPDDHEYWNNFPHASPIIQNSWRAEGRQRWRSASRALYEAFQLSQPQGFGRAVELDVEPLSFFFLDTRTDRAEDRSASVPPAVRQQLRTWVDRVVAARRTAVVTTGQPLSAGRKGRIEGSVGDFTLPNYGDFREIVTTLARVPQAGLPLLLFTGDVHWGRVVTARDVAASGRELIHEVICSPSSLVRSVGKDEIAGIGSALRGLFGRRPEWPLHSDPKDPPDHFAKEHVASRFPVRGLHRQKGNHVATLSFRRAGFGAEAEVRYWPIRGTSAAPRPDLAGLLQLQPA